VILLFAGVYQPKEISTEKSNLATSQTENVLFLGTPVSLQNLDPAYAWELGSFDVIEQVAEGLFGYDFSDPNLALIPKLAADYGDWDGNTYTVELKQGVYFHDGTPFNAYAVEATFTRLQYFMDNGMAQAGDLYRYYDYKTDEMKPIINNVNAVGDYTVEFELDTSYGLLETLLSFEASFILSPSATPPEDYIDLYSGLLVGTGPFVFEYYDGGEVSFRAFENYRGDRASIDHLKFIYITDPDERATALNDGHVHMILNPPTYRRFEFEDNPEFTLDSIESTAMFYLGMNNYWIDRDLREAISYAIDYDFLINDIFGGEANRLKSPVPNGIVYSDDSFNVPTINLDIARAMMQSAGYGIGLALNDPLWETSTFLSLNFSRHTGEINPVREDIFFLLQDNLGKIGIEVVDAPMSYGEFLQRLYEFGGHHRENTQLFWWGWAADYNDASNYINFHFTNRTESSNIVGYNGFDSAIEAGRDPFNLWENVQLLMEEALMETDSLLREQYYRTIQQLLVEEDMPWAYGIVPISEVWYSSEVQGFQLNSLRKLNFYGVSGVLHEEVDTTPPVTEISFNPPWHWSGWFNASVLVTLKADDPSGVMYTWYSFDGVSGFLYTVPFWVHENTTIYYGSVDSLGNPEAPNYIEIIFDKELPVTEVFLSGVEGMNGWYVSDVFVTLESTDELSGVLVTWYTYDGVNIIFPIEPFLIEETSTFYYGAVDYAGNMGVSMITIEIYKTPSAITEKITEELGNLEVPPGAQKHVDKALFDLQAALEKFNDESFYSGIQRIFKTMKHLMDAQNDGADVYSIGKVLVEMVMNMVVNAINDAEEMADEDIKFLFKALEFYNDALAKLSEGKFDQAINLFKHAYKFATKY